MNTPAVGAGCCHHLGRTPNRSRYLFRPGPKPGKTGDDSLTTPHNKTSVSSEDGIVCRQCLHGITSASERKVINGAHAHTFANPEGIVFEIACFRDAWGCVYIGPNSPQFTWFAGYVWRIAVCANCHVHLGWRFSAVGGRFFHGLIASRIIARDA